MAFPDATSSSAWRAALLLAQLKQMSITLENDFNFNVVFKVMLPANLSNFYSVQHCPRSTVL